MKHLFSLVQLICNFIYFTFPHYVFDGMFHGQLVNLQSSKRQQMIICNKGNSGHEAFVFSCLTYLPGCKVNALFKSLINLSGSSLQIQEHPVSFRSMKQLLHSFFQIVLMISLITFKIYLGCHIFHHKEFPKPFKIHYTKIYLIQFRRIAQIISNSQKLLPFLVIDN